MQSVSYLERIGHYNLTENKKVVRWMKAAHEAIDAIEEVVEGVLKSVNGGSTFISPSAIIHPTAIVGNNVYIGSNVEIGPYSFIRSNSILCDGSKVGYCVEIDRCILFMRVKVSHHASVGRCIIGQDSNLAFGFVIATRHLFGKAPTVHYPTGEMFRSSSRHHGAAIGARFHTGVNVAIMPGTTISTDVTVGAGSIISGFLASGSFIK